MLLWGEINAPCALTTLSPSISVVAEYNGTEISTLSLVKDGNLFRFGGPLATDSKLVIPADYSDVNIVLRYSSNVSSFLLGTVAFTSGVVHEYYTLSDTNCLALYPSAHFSVSLTLPSDCNGDLSSMAFYVYYGDTKLYSATLPSGKSATLSFDVNGYKYSIPEGASLSFKVCKDTTCTSWGETYHYGKSSSISQSLSCSTFFPVVQQTETNSTAFAAGAGGATGETNTSAGTTVSGETPPKTVTTNSSVTTKNGSITPENPVHQPSNSNDELNVNVPVTPTEHSPGMFGVPLDQAIVIALVVIVTLIVVIRFFV